MPDLRTHPTLAALSEFLLGKLPARADAEVERHLAACPACQTRAAALPVDDTLVALLAAADTSAGRDAAPLGPTVAGGDTPSAYAATRRLAAPPPVPLVPPDDVPAVLAARPKYRVLRRLGAGGMGTVWLAEHAVMNRPVAVKLIHPDLVAHPGAAARFLREVRAAARLHHPNIVTAFDAEAGDGGCLLVMEYVEGESLSARVRRGPLPVAEACRAVRDAARGLAHAHAAGLTHRDVKPANLVRTADGVTKVLDFGLVGFADAGPAAGTDLTAANAVMGTPDYIAPEQAMDAHAADARSDVYSLGCTLYHLLAGRVPYSHPSALEKVIAHRDPEQRPAAIPNLPTGLGGVVRRMMAKEPGDRYPTAAAVADALAPYCDPAADPPSPFDFDAGTEAGESLVVAPAVREWGEGPRTRRVWWAAAVAVLVAVVAAAAGGVVYKIQRDNEVVTVTTDDPDVEVTMKRNGELVRIVDAKSNQVWELDTKKMRLRPDGSDLFIDVPGKEPMVIRRDGGRVAVTIQRQPAASADAADPSHGERLVLDLDQKAPPLKLVREHPWKERHAYITGFSPDGRYYAASGAASTQFGAYGVRVWSAATGDTVLTAPGAGQFAFDPKGQRIYVHTANDYVVRDWDLAAGKPAGEFKGHTTHVTSVVPSADGRHLVSAAVDQTVRVWDAATRAELHKTTLNETRHLCVASANDGKSVVAYDYWMRDKTYRLIDVATGKVTRRWAAPDEKFTFSVQAAADGKTLATVHPTVIRLWPAGADTPARTVVIGGELGGCALSPDLNWALIATKIKPDVRLVDLRTGKVHGTYPLPHGSLDTHGFSPDMRHAVFCTVHPSTVYLFEMPAEVAGPKKP
jgi:WD40 repeat protein/tRNA A-37 threonylcarbamoyl transferase component Bud32